jgi:hypothetical protein
VLLLDMMRGLVHLCGLERGLKTLAGSTKRMKSKGRDQTKEGATSLFRGLRWHRYHWACPENVGRISRGHISQKKSQGKPKPIKGY